GSWATGPDMELTAKLRAHVEFLASPQLKGRKPGTPGNLAAADYIAAQFRDIGLDLLPSVGSYFQHISAPVGDNLIGVHHPPASSERLARWLLLGAHFDHLGESGGDIYFGADDNASAVAILLETARTLRPLNHFSFGSLAFNAEEPPYFLMGSNFFVQHLPQEIGSPSAIQAVMVMDLMGGVFWPPLRDVVFALGAEKSEKLYRRLKQTTLSDHSLSILQVGIHLIEEVPFVGQLPFSDYHAFRNAGVPYVFLSSGRTPHYHKPTDRPDTLNYERMAQTVLWLQQLIYAMDQDCEPYGFEADRLEFADEFETVRSLVTLAANRATEIPGTSPITRLKLQRDAEWLNEISPLATTKEKIQRLEKISMRLQCLLADVPMAFLI
ncbi:MAG: M28 family peptidase, partial [Nitrospirota bacterium]